MAKTESNQFISSDMEGIKSTPTTTPDKPYVVKAKVVKDHVPAQSLQERYKSESDKTLTEFYNRTADAEASMLCRDSWGRKVEVHVNGWEAANGVQRRFNLGDEVFINHGIMAHTLTLKGGVYHDEPNYVEVMNTPEEIAKYAALIEQHGINFAESSKKKVPPPIRCVVVGDREITIGLCPVYEVRVEDPNCCLNGLKLLEFPNAVMDKGGIDGYGQKHKEKLYYSERDIVKDRTA